MKVVAHALVLCLVGCGEPAEPDEPTQSTSPPCSYAQPECAETAPVDWAPTELDSAEAYRSFNDYDNASCPKQFVVEVSSEALGSPDAYLFRQFAPGAIATEDDCTASRLHVTVLRKVAGEWSQFDSYVVGGAWNGSGCDALGAGKLGPHEVNDSVAHPYSWLDLSGDVEAARILVSGEVGCESREVQLGVVSSR